MATSLSPNLDEILRLGAMSSQYENQQMGLANAFRGLVGLRPVSGVGGNFGANLRASLGIQQKEIEDTLAARMAQQDYEDKKAFRRRWVDEGFSDEYDNIYEVILERVLPKQFSREKSRLDIAGTKTKRSEHDRAEYLIDLIHQWKRRNPDNPLRGIVSTVIQQEGFSGYDVEHFNKLGKQMWPELWGQTKKSLIDLQAAELSLRKGRATEDADIKKAQIEFDKAQLALNEAKELSAAKIAKSKAESRKAQGLDYKEGIDRMNLVADKFEGETNPDRYAVAVEQVDQALRGLNLDGSQVANIQSALARRLPQLAAPDIPAGAKAWIWAYKAADPTGKTKAEYRVDIGVLTEFLKKHYRVDFEMLGMMGPGSWYAENIDKVVESAIEALTPDAELKPIRELKGTGESKTDRKLVNRLPTREEAQSFANRGIIYIITINGSKKTIGLQPQG